MSPAVHLKYWSVGLIRAYWSFKHLGLPSLPIPVPSQVAPRLVVFLNARRFGIPYSYVRDPISIHQKGNSACQAFLFRY